MESSPPPGLQPTAQRRRRVDTRVFEWVEAHETSLASEWLGSIPWPA